MVTHQLFKIRLKNMLKQDGKAVIHAFRKSSGREGNNEFDISLDIRMPV
jgi:hypothetical protein